MCGDRINNNEEDVIGLLIPWRGDCKLPKETLQPVTATPTEAVFMHSMACTYCEFKFHTKGMPVTITALEPSLSIYNITPFEDC
jgi:hypothetical protein